MTCDICSIVEKKKKVKKVYEDNDTFAFLAEKPTTLGHTIIATKKHQQIVTQVEDDVIKKMFSLAQQLSSILLEITGAEGSNIILQNGSVAGQVHPHVLTHIFPRTGQDGITFDWAQKKIPDDKMDEIHKLVDMKSVEQEKEAPKIEQKKEPEKVEAKEDNYLIRQLIRRP